MSRTLRSRKLRGVLFRAAGGRCKLCGCELGVGWHADHINSHANGGDLVIENLQATCAACNTKKGVGVIKLRKWQQRAVAKLRQSLADFFVEATPGAGKTKFSCYVAKDYMDRGKCQRVIVVVPTTSLKEQWAEDLHKVGIDAEWRFAGTAWPQDFHAICVTYQQVASDAALLRHFCGTSGVMVILDEVHHCGDEAHWGLNVRHAFELANFRLSLSGTPFRSDNTSIPFLTYVDGKSKPDIQYGYGEALRDGICRHVFFPKMGGRVEWSCPRGKYYSKTFDDELKENEANQRLRTALTTGDWLPATLQSATDLLKELRQEDHDAAGLVIAIDRSHANAIARIMADRFGIEPDVVTSDDPQAQDKIRSFKTSNRPWIIAVKMVSEGVDIPRLRVGVYATNTTTEMFFRQAIGRFVRVQQDHDDHTASVFIPDDLRLRQYAEQIRSERTHELEQELEAERKRSERESDEKNNDVSLYMPLNSTGEVTGTIIDELTLTPEEIAEAERLCSGLGMKAEAAAALLKRAGHFGTQNNVADHTVDKTETKSDKRKRLKTLAAKAVSQLAYATGESHKDLHYRFNVLAGFQSQAKATIEQLERKIVVVTEALKKAQETVA